MEPLKIVRYYTDTFEIKRDDDGHLIEPKCSLCNSIVTREKCFFELGSNCPRHEMADVYKQALKDDPTNHIFKPYHEAYKLPDICSLCRQSESVH